MINDSLLRFASTSCFCELFTNLLSVCYCPHNTQGGGGEEGASLRTVVAVVSILFALAYAALSVSIYNEGRDLPEAGTGGETQDPVRSAAHLELLSQLWHLVSSCTTALFSLLFVASCALSLVGENAQRLREEGIVNLVLVLLFLVAVGAGAMAAGRTVLHEKKLGTFGVGILSGGTAYLALLLFSVFVSCANIISTEGGNDREEGYGVRTATSYACLFLSSAYLAFAAGIRRYRTSLVGAISDDGRGGGLKRMLFWT